MGKDQGPAGPKIVLLLLFLFPGEVSTASKTASTAEPKYLVLVPFLIHSETPERVCVHLSHLNESVTLSATLDYGAQNRSLIRNVVSEEDFFQCLPFTVPKWNGSSEVSLRVEVKGPTQHYTSQKTVLVKNLESMTFVQTDKPIYNPGERVRFRIVSLSEDFLPVNEKFPLVYIQDPDRNRLVQWQNLQLENGLAQLSFPLSSEAFVGDYKVVVQKSSGSTVEHTFAVKEYVLPKFEVSVKVPKVITIENEELQVTVCGRYTYGKPVPGMVMVHVCRKCTDRSKCLSGRTEPLCEDFSGQADARGCLSRVVKTDMFQLRRKGYEMSIKVTAKIAEESTGVELTGRGSTEITSHLSKLTFERVDSYYKPGVPFLGQVKLVDGTNAPMANETVQIRVYGDSVKYITDDRGKAQFSVNVDNFRVTSFSIQAVYKLLPNSDDDDDDTNWIRGSHESVYHNAYHFYSPSDSYLQIESVSKTLSCEQIQPVRIHYILKPDTIPDKIHFYYLVMAKGGVVESGIHVEPVEHGEAKGVFLLNLSVDTKTAPLARLLVYVILPSGELVAHSADFPVENCFSNKVKLWFSPAEGLPGSSTQLHLTASKHSLCAVRAVDKSVFILTPEAELSPQTVYNLLPVKNLRGYDYQNHHLDEPNMEKCINPRYSDEESVHIGPFDEDRGDLYEVLKNFGLKVFTNAKIRRPKLCFVYIDKVGDPPEQDDEHHPALPMRRVAGAAEPLRLVPHSEEPETAEPVRSVFPETWLWLDIPVSGDGQADVPVTLPDTITEWTTDAFCTSAEAGFGLSPAVSFEAFQPFFLELTMPYSVVRGEAFLMKATVFTYLQHCIRVSISLAPSPDFVASPLEKEEESYCLCTDGRQTVSWTVTPKSLGEVNFTVSAKSLNSQQLCGNEIVQVPSEGQTDTVIRSLLVEPEGEEKEAVLSSVACGTQDPEAELLSLKVPENVVEGSARADFCVRADILGSALKNLDRLVELPYGSGEQNMVHFAPSIYVLDYLNKTGQLTEEIQSKIIGYLVAGYQRQLHFKFPDGSYSAFGTGWHGPGNTWLTAFVLKSFGQARRFIFVENQHIMDAEAFLAGQQKENGCFQSHGFVLEEEIKGGVDDELTLSAYITIALLEISRPVSHPVVRKALVCLETAAQGKDLHVYTRALLAYAFALAGNEEKKGEMLSSLGDVAVKGEDDSIHWERPGRRKWGLRLTVYGPLAPSAEVETTSYVLLAYLTERPALSPKALAKASGIVKWLSKQQNPRGGFSSIQDTVVALQALALYEASTYSRSEVHAEVKLLSGELEVHPPFRVDNANRLLLQCGAVPEVPGNYHTEVTGEGCVYMQTTLRYNVHPRHEGDSFTLEVHTVPETCVGPKAEKEFNVAINVSYTGMRPVSNMAIVDVKLPSGFIPVRSSVRKLKGQNMVKRTEERVNRVLLYLEQVSNVTQSYSFTVEREVPVQDLKPAFVKVYDYYKTDEYAVTEYSAPCSTGEVKQTKA